MTDLTVDTPRPHQGAIRTQIEWPMAANTQLFWGAALMMAAATGYAANCTPTASGVFLGFAQRQVDNRTGSPYGGTAASTTIGIAQRGRIELTVANGSNWALTDIGATVYASDGNTFTTSAGTNNILIGKVAQVPASIVGAATGAVLVDFEATSIRSL